ncbi:hypothetical protein [Evansella tamaricis]|uniref:DUF4352 domain-containing protein n=1 Tax=Evansella tamaricis TaxID=2069301 RepID=A0ABS6J9I4_9BACI|nr:hypothetical protein [Evansella tamaricis]MBU9710186.1 hypothetical protein [Evansella tamaricis]
MKVWITISLIILTIILTTMACSSYNNVSDQPNQSTTNDTGGEEATIDETLTSADEEEWDGPKRERDWASIKLEDWVEKEIRLTKAEFRAFLHWVSEDETYATGENYMVDHETIVITFNPLDEGMPFTYDMIGSVVEPHIREAYKASTFYQNQQEPTIIFQDSDGENLFAYETNMEERLAAREGEREENLEYIGNFRMNDEVEFENEVISITGGSTITRRLEEEIYTPRFVVRLGITFRNTSDENNYATASLFSISDSRGRELDIYPLEEIMGEMVPPGEEIHAPLYFVASGTGPYDITYTTENERATWVISDGEVELHRN